MLLTQTFVELGQPNWTPIGVYFDEVELSYADGHGQSIKAHIEELAKRSENLIVVGVQFDMKPSTRAHASYRLRTVSVTGDLYDRPSGEYTERQTN